MVNVDSDVARAHPEWVMAARRELPVESRFQQVLNIGHPAAYAHVRDQLVAVLSDYPIDYVKWDHNRDLVEPGDQTRGGRPAVHAQTLAFYRLLDELRERFPLLEIESCAAGGGRVDLEVLERAERVWVSDDIDPLERQTMLPWTGQLHPARAHRVAHRVGPLSPDGARPRPAVPSGYGGLRPPRHRVGPDRRERRRPAELAAWVGFYKERRALLHTGRLVRGDHPDPAVWVNGVVAQDRSSALFSVATMAATATPSVGRVRFPGLDPDVTYHLHAIAPAGAEPVQPRRRVGPGLPDVVMSGLVLAQVGVELPPVRPESVLLFAAEAI